MTSSLMSHIVSIYKAVTDDVNTTLMSTPHVWGGNLLHWPVTRQSRHACVYLQRQEPFTRLRTLPWLADQRRRHTSTTVWTHACLNTESGKQYKYMQITRRAFCQQNTMTYSLRLVHLAQDMGAAVGAGGMCSPCVAYSLTPLERLSVLVFIHIEITHKF